MIAITGAGGFIGSVLVGYLNAQGINNLVLFDDLPHGDQFKNLVGKNYISLHSTEELFADPEGIDAVIHIGADASTLTKDWASLYKTNVLSTRNWSNFCSHNNIPFIFTSSAAVYGNGAGPLNHYAFSKQVSENEIEGVVLRLFNVYGPNEYHKGRMASTVYHWYNQLTAAHELKIFKDRDKLTRDFVYVEDVAKVIYHFLQNYEPGVYDLGTGNARSFTDVSTVLRKYVPGAETYIDMPGDLTAQYQRTTCADLTALKDVGFDITQLRSIELGIPDYLSYLKSQSLY